MGEVRLGSVKVTRFTSRSLQEFINGCQSQDSPLPMKGADADALLTPARIELSVPNILGWRK
jgi:hypothetical protein